MSEIRTFRFWTSTVYVCSTVCSTYLLNSKFVSYREFLIHPHAKGGTGSSRRNEESSIQHRTSASASRTSEYDPRLRVSLLRTWVCRKRRSLEFLCRLRRIPLKDLLQSQCVIGRRKWFDISSEVPHERCSLLRPTRGKN